MKFAQIFTDFAKKCRKTLQLLEISRFQLHFHHDYTGDSFDFRLNFRFNFQFHSHRAVFFQVQTDQGSATATLRVHFVAGAVGMTQGRLVGRWYRVGRGRYQILRLKKIGVAILRIFKFIFSINLQICVILDYILTVSENECEIPENFQTSENLP